MVRLVQQREERLDRLGTHLLPTPGSAFAGCAGGGATIAAAFGGAIAMTCCMPRM